LIQGLGVGLLFAPLNTLAYATLPAVHRTEATIVSTMARSLGSSLGISVLQASLTHGIALAHASLAGRIVGGDPVIRSILPPLMDPGAPGGLALLEGFVSRQASMLGYTSIFAWMALATVMLVPLTLLMRPPRRGAGFGLESQPD
jgi:DHA2 family multidrug resistance protein